MLELRNIVAGYGDSTVLHGVDLSVPPGTVVALLGSNGAGKTTLLRVASGLLSARGGSSFLDGENITGLAPHALTNRGICHVPEGRGVFPSLTVVDNLRVYAAKGRESDLISQATDAFPRLGERLHQAAGTLSGGEQQMLALARSYAQDARYILLDEVSMGLAPSLVDEIFAFLGRLAATGRSLLLVEQYVTRALAIADYVVVLAKGVVTFVGEPAELDPDELFRTYSGVAPEERVSA